MSPADSKPKYSIVVPVYNNASDLRECLASLDAQSYDRSQFEVIVVDNNSTDETVLVAEDAGVKCLHEHDFQSSYAARNRGITAARGEFIVFLDSDCVAHPDWLSHIEVASKDDGIGCLAGEILSKKPTTTVERFSDSVGLLRQRGPLSGWHFKPYAQTANATYRKVVFDKIGLFDPTMKSGGDAILAWRMLDRTNFQIRFVPEAIVYHHHRTTVRDLWSQFRRYGSGKLSWTLSQSDYKPPAVTKLEEDLVAMFDELVTDLETNEANSQEVVFPLLRTITQVAHYSGYLQDLLKLMSHGAGHENWPRVACKRATICNICGSHAFVPGPGKRLVGMRGPQCFQCGSLEQHRVLHSVLSALDRTELAYWTCLSVGEPLHQSLKWFAQTSHVDFPGPAINGACSSYDLVIAISALHQVGDVSIEDMLATLVSPLKDSGMLILVDPVPDKFLNELTIDYERWISQCLPNVSVRSSWALDQVTGVTKMVTLATADSSKTSRISLHLSRAILANLTVTDSK